MTAQKLWPLFHGNYDMIKTPRLLFEVTNFKRRLAETIKKIIPALVIRGLVEFVDFY